MHTARVLSIVLIASSATILFPSILHPKGPGSRAALAGGKAPKGLHIPAGQQVSFNHNFTDGGGFRWDIQRYGSVQSGTNNAYGGGMYCQVQSSNVRSNTNRGQLNAAGDELEIGPYSRQNLRCYRRIKVYKDQPLARWLDIFENPTNQLINVSVAIYTNTSYGLGSIKMNISGGASFGEKDWAFVTQPTRGNNVPRLLHIVCAKKAKVRPSVRIQGNQIYLRYNLAIPAGQTVILCHFESQNPDAAAHWKLLKKFRAHRLMKDLSHGVRKLIVNFPTFGDWGGVELDRMESSDLIVLSNGDPVCGKIVNKSYEIDGFLGKVTVPSAKVVGMAVAPGDAGMVAVLVDGQAIFGTIRGELTLRKIGGTLKIPFEKVRQWSYRISKDRPDEAPANGAMLMLRTGDRLAFDPAATKLWFRTRDGELDLRAEDLMEVVLDDPDGGAHRAKFRNGSFLAGFLGPETLDVTLKLDGRKVKVQRDAVASVHYFTEEIPNEHLTHFKLTNGDDLVGRIEEAKVRLQTEYGELSVEVRNLRAVSIDRSRPELAAVQLWDGSILRGVIHPDALTVAISPKAKLTVSLAHVSAIVRSQALPPEEIIQQAKRLVPRLGAESFKDREEAKDALIQLGPGIIPILKEHRGSIDPEIRDRIEQIIEKLSSQGSPPAPVLPAPGMLRWHG